MDIWWQVTIIQKGGGSAAYHLGRKKMFVHPIHPTIHNTCTVPPAGWLLKILSWIDILILVVVSFTYTRYPSRVFQHHSLLPGR